MALLTVVSFSCIENDIPYPIIKLEILGVEAEGLKLDFLNPHQPRKHLQERMPQMVLCVCV